MTATFLVCTSKCKCEPRFMRDASSPQIRQHIKKNDRCRITTERLLIFTHPGTEQSQPAVWPWPTLWWGALGGWNETNYMTHIYVRLNPNFPLTSHGPVRANQPMPESVHVFYIERLKSWDFKPPHIDTNLHTSEIAHLKNMWILKQRGSFTHDDFTFNIFISPN